MTIVELCELVRMAIAVPDLDDGERAEQLNMLALRASYHLRDVELGERRLVTQLLSDLCSVDLLNTTSSVISRQTPTVAHQAKEIILTSYTQRLTVAFIAESLSVSPKTLSRAYQRTFGMTVASDIRAIRISKAVELVRVSDLKLEAVAREVGFKSKKDLYRLIRETYGTTPGALRRSLAES